MVKKDIERRIRKMFDFRCKEGHVGKSVELLEGYCSFCGQRVDVIKEVRRLAKLISNERDAIYNEAIDDVLTLLERLKNEWK